MRLRTRTHIWLFAAAVTLFAGVAVMIEYFVLAPVLGSLGASIVIAPLAAGPVSFLIGGKFRELTLLYDEREKMIRHDRLTQALSREGFFAEADRREGQGATFVIDLDHFKAINDTWGHLVGDEVLRTTARILMAQVRHKDLVCRFGGEEFIVLASDIDRREAFAMAERIRRRVSDTPILVSGERISVTVSIGVTDHMSGDEIQEAIRVADAALYSAKRGGRNRVVADWGDGAPPPDPADDLLPQLRRAG